jgi:hypothetical protein
VYGVNICLTNAKLLTIIDFIDVDENFINKLFTYGKNECGLEIELTAETLIELYGGTQNVLNAVTSGYTQFYFDESHLVLSFTTTQALLYYIKVWMPWSKIILDNK